MSSGPVARWLETFVCNSMCRQYVEVFQEFGYNNLNEICNLNAQQLLKMGVSLTDTEKIIDNVSVLKQTMQANAVTNSQNYPSRDNQLDSMSCNFDSPIATSNTKPRKNKSNKANATDSKQKQLVPNVTINQVVPNNQQPLLLPINNNNNNTNTPSRKTKPKNAKNKNQIQIDIKSNDNNNNNISIGLGIIGSDNNSNNNKNSNNKISTADLNLMNNNNNLNLSGQSINSKLNTVNNNSSSSVNSTSTNSTTNTSNSTATPTTTTNNSNTVSTTINTNTNKANTDAAKKIGNDILNMATMSQSNTKFTCLPISNSNSPINYSYEFQQQNQYQYQSQQQQQSQYRNYQQSQSPTILMSPISNPSSTSSTNSLSSNQLYSQHSPPTLIQQQQQSSSTIDTNYMNPTKPQYYQQQQQQQQQQPQSQYYEMNHYNNVNKNNSSSDYYSNCNGQSNYGPSNGFSNHSNGMTYTSSVYSNQIKTPATPLTGAYNSNPQFLNSSNCLINNGNKNSPLEYLERLALLPECQVIDPKSIVNETTTNEINNNSNYNNENINGSQMPMSIANSTSFDLIDNSKIYNKRNLNDMPDLLSSPLQANKKACNSSNFKASLYTTGVASSHNQSQKLYQHQYSMPPAGHFSTDQVPSGDLLSNEMSIQNVISASNITNNSNNDNQINLASSIIDACNFDFLDYLPELNSTTIDQTIKTATSLTNSNITSINNNNNSMSNPAVVSLDDIAYTDTMYNLN